MRNRIQFYRLWRQISIVMMAAVVAAVLAATFMSTPSYATNPHLTKVCSYKGVHFCLLVPSDGPVQFTSVSHTIGPISGLT